MSPESYLSIGQESSPSSLPLPRFQEAFSLWGFEFVISSLDTDAMLTNAGTNHAFPPISLWQVLGNTIKMSPHGTFSDLFWIWDDPDSDYKHRRLSLARVRLYRCKLRSPVGLPKTFSRRSRKRGSGTRFVCKKRKAVRQDCRQQRRVGRKLVEICTAAQERPGGGDHPALREHMTRKRGAGAEEPSALRLARQTMGTLFSWVTLGILCVNRKRSSL